METLYDIYLQNLKTEHNKDILFQTLQYFLKIELEKKLNISEQEYDNKGYSHSLDISYGNLCYQVDYNNGELMFGHIPHKHIQIKKFLQNRYDLKYLGKFRYNTGNYRSFTETFIKFKCKDYNELREALLNGCSIHELRNSQK